ncbi:MAG: CvpA family protein, partial [Acidobacteriaceae bacterium]|nr:CvpA family protein [Acidobacteriaceae bacterium]
CSVVSGFSAGFARVSIGTAATFIGIFAGFWCYGLAGAYVQDYVSSRPVANLIGFVLVFGAVVIAGALLARLAAWIFKWIGLSWLDRMLGAGFGIVRGFLIAVAFVTVFIAFAPNPPPRSITDSKVLPYVMEASNVLSFATPHEIKDAFRETKEKVKRIWDSHAAHQPLRRSDV